MTKRIVLVLLTACFCLAVNQGCSRRAWFEGFKERQRQECYRNIDQDQIQRCLDQVNDTTYDEYERARDGSVERIQ